MDSTYLEVGIGLVVVFFVVATVADGFNEIISRMLNTRAKALWAALGGLLSDMSEDKPDLGIGFIFKSILPSWLGGADARPRVAGDALSGVDRAKLIEWIVTGKDHVALEHRAEAEAAFRRIYSGISVQARAQFRSAESKVRWWLEKVTDEELLAVAQGVIGEYGNVQILYPPLQDVAVRERLLPHYLTGNEDNRNEIAEWIARLPLNDKARYLAELLPMTAEVINVLSDGNGFEAARLAAMGDDQERYRDHDPGLGRTISLLRTGQGHQLAEGYLEANRPDVPDVDSMARWLFGLPIKSQVELMQNATYTGEYLTSAARTAALLASASVSGLDFVRQRGRKTKVWWVDGKTFGSALWELAKDRNSSPIEEGEINTNAIEGLQRLASEWRGTPLGDYLASTGIDRARSVDQFVSATGAWFDGQMEQLSLSYRRNVKYVLGMFGFAMAMLFNLNAIGLAGALINDAEARATLDAYSASILNNACNGATGAENVANEADEACIQGANKVEAQLDALRSLDDLGVPLLSENWKAWRGLPNPVELLGMLVTAAAVSYGGVFWFDFLKFLTGVRRRV